MIKNANKLADTVTPVKRKTPEMEALLGVGYGGMTVASAKQIIKERDANPMAHPYEVYQDAKAFLQAYETEGVAVSTRAGWRRTKV